MEFYSRVSTSRRNATLETDNQCKFVCGLGCLATPDNAGPRILFGQSSDSFTKRLSKLIYQQICIHLERASSPQGVQRQTELFTAVLKQPSDLCKIRGNQRTKSVASGVGAYKPNIVEGVCSNNGNGRQRKTQKIVDVNIII